MTSRHGCIKKVRAYLFLANATWTTEEAKKMIEMIESKAKE